jgi:hypothetical protein
VVWRESAAQEWAAHTLARDETAAEAAPRAPLPATAAAAASAAQEWVARTLARDKASTEAVPRPPPPTVAALAAPAAAPASHVVLEQAQALRKDLSRLLDGQCVQPMWYRPRHPHATRRLRYDGPPY